MAGRVPGRAMRSAVVALCLLAAPGCVGDTDRDEFDQMLQQRSLGLPASLPGRALDAVAEELGTAEVTLRSLQADGTEASVTVDVLVDVDRADPARRRYRYAAGALSGPEEVPLGYAAVESVVFEASDVPALREVRPLLVRTLEELDLGEGERVERLTATREGGDGVRVVVEARSDEGVGTATFDADGTFVSADR